METNLLIFLIVIVALLLIILLFNFIIIGTIRERINDLYKILYEQVKVFKEFVMLTKEKFEGFEHIEKCINNTNKIIDNRVEEIHKHLFELEEKYLKDENYSTKKDIENIRNTIVNNTKLITNTITDNVDTIIVKIKENQPYLVGIEMPKSFSDAFDDLLKKSSTKEKK